MIKAIDTFYKGNYFRSRLEARWAVFFDEIVKNAPERYNVWPKNYEYEPEGYITEAGGYLPDFYLPATNIYVEVKPELHEETATNIRNTIIKAISFVIEKKSNFMLCMGKPRFNNIHYICYLNLEEDITAPNYNKYILIGECLFGLLNGHFKPYKHDEYNSIGAWANVIEDKSLKYRFE